MNAPPACMQRPADLLSELFRFGLMGTTVVKAANGSLKKIDVIWAQARGRPYRSHFRTWGLRQRILRQVFSF